MVEFGEQLKKAREAKGMTQQTLAEHLYVTRQAVSRWERGDRYPDLITAKKLAAFLDVSLDDLLLIVVNLLGLLIQTVVFVCGFLWAFKGRLTPKKTGVSIAVYFFSLCLTNSFRITVPGLGRKTIVMDLLLIVPYLAGAIAAFQYFYKAKMASFLYWTLIAVSGWEILRIFWTVYANIRWAAEFVSMNTALNFLLKICISLLIIYQTCIVKRKRALAVISNE